MPDYEKLTVVKLRDELIARGLPRAGLKAVLVQRLIEADAQSAEAESAANKYSERSQEDNFETRAASCLPHALRESEGSKHAAYDAPLSGEPEKDGLNFRDVGDKDAQFHQPDETARAQDPQGEVQGDEQMERKVSDGLKTPPGSFSSLKGTHNGQNPRDQNEDVKEPELQSPIPTHTHIEELKAAEDKAEVSTQSFITGDEILEDSRKRKRRSRSPPPSSMENTQKRFKANSGRPIVELPEDSMAAGTDRQDRPNNHSSRSNPRNDQEIDTPTNGDTCVNGERNIANINTSATVGQDDARGIIQPQIDSSAINELSPPKEKIATPTHVKRAESPLKPSPPDTRFKGLFMAPTHPETASRKPHYPDAEEKTVSPALHPATSALYIRELMRPLKIESLRDHLINLATPPDTKVNADIVTDFFLDSIRTHCLVGFGNISAASRVRSGLHDRVWPNERDRRQVWVDFVPEDKLKKWIDIEQTAANGRGQPSKRWEVVYLDEGNGIKAYLQEARPNSGGFRAIQSPKLDAGNSGLEPQSSQPRPDSGKGFRALDDLFTSTRAKPKLYYLPIPKAEADRRLAKLAAGRGGGRGGEMRRFSFEEGFVVDNGPEFGRGRRGGYSGNNRGRGRGHRVASRGDIWRERRY